MTAKLQDLDRLQRRQEQEHLENTFMFQIKAMRLAVPVRELKFCDDRRWRFDFAYPDRKLAVEIEGGTGRVRGRHVRPAGFRSDCEKYNAAAMLGWRVLRFPGAAVISGEAVDKLKRVLDEMNTTGR
jgi:very-short-patch-repair endonuclease